MSELISKWKEIDLSPNAKEALSKLEQGHVMALRMKHVANGKVQIEFAEKIDSPNPVKSALGLLNASDKRFNNSSGARRSWETAEPSDVKTLFGYEIPDGEAFTEILSVVPAVNGQRFAIQIIEQTEPAWMEANKAKPEQLEYLEGKLKRAGAEGNFFYTLAGNRVVSETRLVTAPVGTVIEHAYLEGSYKSTEEVMGGVSSTAQITAVI